MSAESAPSTDETPSLREVLVKHRGRDDAITSSELAARVGVADSNGNPRIRADIRDLIEETGLPIASCSQGYFVLSSRTELQDYLHDLTRRQQGIEERKRLVREAFVDDHGHQVTLSGGADA